MTTRMSYLLVYKLQCALLKKRSEIHFMTSIASWFGFTVSQIRYLPLENIRVRHFFKLGKLEEFTDVQ